MSSEQPTPRRRQPKRVGMVVPKPEPEPESSEPANEVLEQDPSVTGRRFNLKVDKAGKMVSQRMESSALSSAKTDYGYPLDVVRSSLQKAIRRGQSDVAAWWGWMLIKHGWHAYLWRTLAICSTEDVGIGDPTCVQKVMALYEAARLGTNNWAKDKSMFIGLWEMQAIITLCEAPKSWRVTHLYCSMQKRMKQVEKGEIPLPQPNDEALDGHTDIGRRMGRTKQLWWNEGDALEPKAPDHYLVDPNADEWADIHGDPEAS